MLLDVTPFWMLQSSYLVVTAVEVGKTTREYRLLIVLS
ncbi:hypothetical protein, partial [Helicobacter typhlonius]